MSIAQHQSGFTKSDANNYSYFLFKKNNFDLFVQNLTIMFEDPVDEDMATAELMLSDVTSPQ